MKTNINRHFFHSSCQFSLVIPSVYSDIVFLCFLTVYLSPLLLSVSIILYNMCTVQYNCTVQCKELWSPNTLLLQRVTLQMRIRSLRKPMKKCNSCHSSKETAKVAITTRNKFGPFLLMQNLCILCIIISTRIMLYFVTGM